MMTPSLCIALAQLNPVLGDIAGNCARILQAQAQAKLENADLVLFPELFICGYPPEDLVLKPAFQAACRRAVEELAARTVNAPALLIGTPWMEDEKLYNAMILLADGQIQGVRTKHDLPNYGVFDEKRVFAAGEMPLPLLFKGVQLGLPICEDIWQEASVAHLKEHGAELLLVANGSPFWRNKSTERLIKVQARVRESGLPLVYLNRVGGQDELVFDCASFVLNGDGTLAAQLPNFEACLRLTHWRRTDQGMRCEAGVIMPHDSGEAAVYRACVLGLKDYVERNGFSGVVLGLSGGIDSALVAAMAVDALGAERVHCLMLPYRYTSQISLKDAQACAQRLGMRYDVLPIAAPVEGFEAALAPLFAGTTPDITEENLQSRTRGTLLMAVSNKFGAMVLTTGNKSELSVGYATLYGDMNGGFNPIKDLYKMEVFALARWRNQHHLAGLCGALGEVIPASIIDKAPSAELRDNQKDQDSLPPYEVLDALLYALIEEEKSVADIIDAGFDADTVRRIEHLVLIAEYKRRQSAPGVKISQRQFGRDRRYPITNKFRG